MTPAALYWLFTLAFTVHNIEEGLFLPAYAADDVERHLSALREAGVRVEDLEIRKADLEDVFLKMMGATPEAPPPAGRADLAEAEA